jgi:hypothetical protein
MHNFTPLFGLVNVKNVFSDSVHCAEAFTLIPWIETYYGRLLTKEIVYQLQ